MVKQDVITIYSITSIAKRKKVSREHVRQLIEEGKIPPHKYTEDSGRMKFWDSVPNVEVCTPGRRKKTEKKEHEKP